MQTKRGFGAALMLMMFSFGSLALAIVANGAAAAYADSVDRYGSRLQAGLDATACADSVLLIKAKDHFATGQIDIPELNCHEHL